MRHLPDGAVPQVDVAAVRDGREDVRLGRVEGHVVDVAAVAVHQGLLSMIQGKGLDLDLQEESGSRS